MHFAASRNWSWRRPRNSPTWTSASRREPGVRAWRLASLSYVSCQKTRVWRASPSCRVIMYGAREPGGGVRISAIVAETRTMRPISDEEMSARGVGVASSAGGTSEAEATARRTRSRASSSWSCGAPRKVETEARTSTRLPGRGRCCSGISANCWGQIIKLPVPVPSRRRIR